MRGTPLVAQGSSNSRQYTGHERDPEIGSDYMLARFYSSALGRFTRVDPKQDGADANVPLTWNRYAYALNNPTNNIDPDGQFYWGVHRYQTGGLLASYGKGTWTPTEIRFIAQGTADVDLKAETNAFFNPDLHFGDQAYLDDLIGRARCAYANEDRALGNELAVLALHLAFDLGAHEGTTWAKHGLRKALGFVQHSMGLRNTADPDSPGSPGFAQRYFLGLSMLRDAAAKIATGDPHAWGYGVPEGAFVLEVMTPGASRAEAEAMGDGYAAKGYTVYIDDVCYKNC